MVRLGSIQGTVPFSILAGILSTPYKEFNPCSSISAIVYQNHLFWWHTCLSWNVSNLIIYMSCIKKYMCSLIPRFRYLQSLIAVSMQIRRGERQSLDIQGICLWRIFKHISIHGPKRPVNSEGSINNVHCSGHEGLAKVKGLGNYYGLPGLPLHNVYVSDQILEVMKARMDTSMWVYFNTHPATFGARSSVVIFWT